MDNYRFAQFLWANKTEQICLGQILILAKYGIHMSIISLVITHSTTLYTFVFSWFAIYTTIKPKLLF